MRLSLRRTLSASLVLTAFACHALPAMAGLIHVDARGTVYNGPVRASFDVPDDGPGGTYALGDAHLIRPASSSSESDGWPPYDETVDSRFNLRLDVSRPGGSDPTDTAGLTLSGKLAGRLAGTTLTSNISGGFEGTTDSSTIRIDSARSSLPREVLDALSRSTVRGQMTGGIRNVLELRLTVPPPAVPGVGAPEPVPEPTTLVVLVLGLSAAGIGRGRARGRLASSASDR